MANELSPVDISEKLKNSIEKLNVEMDEDDDPGIMSSNEKEAEIEFLAIATSIIRTHSVYPNFDIASLYMRLKNLALPVYSFTFGKGIIDYVRTKASMVNSELIEEALDLLSINPNAYKFMDHVLEDALRDVFIKYSRYIVQEFLKR